MHFSDKSQCNVQSMLPQKNTVYSFSLPSMDRDLTKIFEPEWQHSKECIYVLRNIAMHENQESLTTGQKDGGMDRQMPNKVIPMFRYI